MEEALAEILGRAEPLGAEQVPLGGSAVGRVLSSDAEALTDLPPFPSSAMDGFALRAGETPGRFPVTFRIAAGRPASTPLEPGEAMGIATGGVVPDGADAVVPIEYVVDHDNSIEVPDGAALGANVRPAGSDIRAGEVVVSGGTRLGATQIGALAAAGIGELTCGRRPRAALVVTGTELRVPGDLLGPGEIYESNGPMLDAQLRTAGAEVEGHATVEDDEETHVRALREGLESADFVLTSGGVSVGPHDLVRRSWAELGVEEVFWGVAVKPGKPLFFGVRDRVLVFGLPGNPVSSLVSFELFVRPAVLALQGASDPGPRFETGELAAPVRRNPDRDQFLRGNRETTDGLPRIAPLSGQDSHMIARAAAADVLLHVPRGDGEIAGGAPVRFARLD